jgi:hypothetical protein
VFSRRAGRWIRLLSRGSFARKSGFSAIRACFKCTESKTRVHIHVRLVKMYEFTMQAHIEVLPFA